MSEPRLDNNNNEILRDNIMFDRLIEYWYNKYYHRLDPKICDVIQMNIDGTTDAHICLEDSLYETIYQS